MSEIAHYLELEAPESQANVIVPLITIGLWFELKSVPLGEIWIGVAPFSNKGS